MTKITIGHRADNHVVELNLQSLVDTRLLVQANSGGGKSWLLRLLVERAARHVQTIILDPEGEFSTLREKLDMALVGHDGEMATDLRSAGLLARRLVELRIPAVVDLYDLRLPDRRAYVRQFLEALLSVPRAHWHPLLVVLDEAHLFAPERSAGEAESTAAVIALMSQGRKRGFAGILSTQRLSKLHKDAAAESNNVIIGRTWLDVDQVRAGDLLGKGKADRSELRDLAPGEFFAFGPALLPTGVVRFRSDPVATTHPRAGARHELQVPQASAAIQEVVKQIGDLPAQVEQEAHDLRTSETRVRDLERQLRARPVQIQPAAPERIVERIEIQVFKDGEVGRLEAAVVTLAAVGTQLAAAGETFKASAAEVSGALRAVVSRPAARPLPAPSAPPSRSIILGRAAARDVRVQARSTAAGPAEGVTAPQQRILDALAWLESIGVGRAVKVQLALLAEQSPTSSGYTNNLGSLRTAGLITYPAPSECQLTEAGRAVANMPTAPPTTAELQRQVLARLTRPKAAILQALLESYPEALAKDELAERAGQSPTSSGYTNNLGSLRSLGLIDYPTPGHAVACPVLFLES